MKTSDYPTGAELYALERAAHRERARAQARLLLTAYEWIRDAAKAFHG